jgi:hypothetical protein
MKKLTLIIITISSVLPVSFSDAAERQHKARSHRQQKRLKINPITDYEDAWTANIETNVYRSGTFENVSLGYSATSGWDFSLSLINTQILGSNNQFQGDTFLNIAKTFVIHPELTIVVGSQNGYALVNTQPQLWYSFTYLDNRYEVNPWFLLHGGPYLANAALTGTSRQIGFMTGTAITIIQNKLSLEMDYISGHQSLSVATVNLLFNISARCQLYMGVSVPEQNSGNEFAGNIGINLSTKNL